MYLDCGCFTWRKFRRVSNNQPCWSSHYSSLLALVIVKIMETEFVIFLSLDITFFTPYL